MSDFKKYANSFQTVINLGLNRINLLLGYMGNPHHYGKYIHIAGTNAKGSVCAFLEASLIHSGLKVGKYTSPNLVRVNERITINGEEIPDCDLTKKLSEIEKIADKVREDTGEYPSQFEIWTAVMFSYFKEKNCDIVILETGLGGRFDATNVIKENVMSIITKIALDHTEYLGNTLSEIAFEKCGIIKKNSKTVTLMQNSEVMEVIKSRAKEENNELYIASPISPTHTKEIYEKYEDVFLSLGGIHQLENASIAVCALKALDISEESIKYGLSHAKHSARFQLLKNNPPVIFDGAHNPDGITSLKNGLLRYFPNSKFTYICAFMKDKDIENSLLILKETAEEFCFTKVIGNERCAPKEQLLEIAHRLNIKAKFFETAKDAISYTHTKNSPVVICGSLYLYSDVEKIL